MMRRLFFFLLASLAGIGCSGSELEQRSRCRSSGACTAGEACVENACRPLCAADEQCAAGMSCRGGLCQTLVADVLPTHVGQHLLQTANQAANSPPPGVLVLQGEPGVDGAPGRDGTDGRTFSDATDEELATRITEIANLLNLLPTTTADRGVRVPLDLRAFQPLRGPTMEADTLVDRFWEFTSRRYLRRTAATMSEKAYMQLPIPHGARIKEVFFRVRQGDGAYCNPTVEIVKYTDLVGMKSCGVRRASSVILRFNQATNVDLDSWHDNDCYQAAASTDNPSTNISYYVKLSLTLEDGELCAGTSARFRWAWLEYEFPGASQ